MSILDKLFGPKKDPMKEAGQYLNQIPGVGHDAYDPYISMGQNAGSNIQSEFERLLSDPTAFINKLMEGYKPSEGYQFQRDELQKLMGNNSAAGGVAGTPYDTNQQGEQIQGLLSKDMQQYLENALGVYGKGLTGEQGLFDTGFNASKGLGDLLGNNLAAEGGLAFQGAQQNNADRTGLISLLAKALGTGIGAFSGGLKGAESGGKLAGSLFGS